MALAYTDSTIMTFGKHKGKALANIPAQYFLYLYDNRMISNQALLQYVERNMDALKKEAGIKPKYS